MSNYDPYLLPDANVLDNCLQEKNSVSLQEHETFFSGLRIRELIDEPPTGKFDYNYLRHVHSYLFQDLYPAWAGTTRTIPIHKRERLLAGKSVKYTNPGKKGQHIETEAAELFEALEQDSYLQSMERKAFNKSLAIFLARLWQLHPFREGNTRTILVMCYHIARQAGHPLSLGYIDNQHGELRDSLVFSTQGDLKNLEKFLLAATRPANQRPGLCRKILASLRRQPAG